MAGELPGLPDDDEDFTPAEIIAKYQELVRTHQESNMALMRERTNLIETKREQIARLQARMKELERERDETINQLDSMTYDRDVHRDQCRNLLHRAEVAEARVKELEERWEHFQKLASEHRDELEAKLAEADRVIEPFVKEASAWEGYSDDEPLVEGFRNYHGELRVKHLRDACAYREGRK